MPLHDLLITLDPYQHIRVRFEDQLHLVYEGSVHDAIEKLSGSSSSVHVLRCHITDNILLIIVRRVIDVT